MEILIYFESSDDCKPESILSFKQGDRSSLFSIYFEFVDSTESLKQQIKFMKQRPNGLLGSWFLEHYLENSKYYTLFVESYNFSPKLFYEFCVSLCTLASSSINTSVILCPNDISYSTMVFNKGNVIDVFKEK